jgi:lysozyme
MPKLNKKAVAAVAAVALSIGTLIKPLEGLSLTSYPDIVGVWTACYGETLGIRKGMKFTKPECDEKLLTRVTNDYYVPLTGCIADFDRKPVEWQAAAISVTYNVGVGAACKSTFARLARENRIKESCHAMTAFNKAGGRVVQGLVNRRATELKLCLKGVPEGRV